MARHYMIKVKSIDDLVNVAVAAQTPLIHRVVTGSKVIFYLPFPVYDSLAIYYYETEKDMKGKYFVLDRFTGNIQISENYVNDSKSIVIPIVDVVEEGLLPKDFLIEQKKTPKKKKKKEERTPKS